MNFLFDFWKWFFEEALNAVKFLGWLKKKFGLAQNILCPAKGQGINTLHVANVVLFLAENSVLQMHF